MSYKIIYHIGNEINISTKAKSGSLSLQELSIIISGLSTFELPYSSLLSAQLFRLNGLGRMIKVVCSDRIIFLSVVRLNIAGYFVIINFLRTGELYKKIKAKLPQ